jgi:putative transposase
VPAVPNMALQQRRPHRSVIHHRDEGSQPGLASCERCQKMGVKPSMGTAGDAYDDATAESFLTTLEGELIVGRSWRTKTEASCCQTY